MIKLISLVGTLTQTRMEIGRVTFPCMGFMKGQYFFVVTNPKVFIKVFIYTFISYLWRLLIRFHDFITMGMLISLKCICTLFKTRMCAW